MWNITTVLGFFKALFESWIGNGWYPLVSWIFFVSLQALYHHRQGVAGALNTIGRWIQIACAACCFTVIFMSAVAFGTFVWYGVVANHPFSPTVVPFPTGRIELSFAIPLLAVQLQSNYTNNHPSEMPYIGTDHLENLIEYITRVKPERPTVSALFYFICP